MWSLPSKKKTYFYLGLSLFFIFILQEMLFLKMAWLEQLQQQEPFKIYTGLLLIMYLVALFIMPYNRHCKTPHVVRGISYKQHLQRGALAPLFFFSTQQHGEGLIYSY
jgi:hypothetical protein